MRLTVSTVDGDSLTVEQFDPDGVPDLLTAVDDLSVNSIRLDLDGGRSFVQVVRAHIVRVDIDWDDVPEQE